jgi:hypothetical protein
LGNSRHDPRRAGRTGRFYRAERATGKSPGLVEISAEIEVRCPDGMRAANGKLPGAKAGGARLLSLIITGNSVNVTVLKGGLG